jgi:small subunit ribosomal protein S13
VIWVSLSYIHGIGPTNSRIILKEAGIEFQRRAKELTEEELAKIITIIDRDYVVEGALRRQTQQNVARLRDIGSYRGNRHRRSLPVRGQRTRSNARTRKGPRKTVAGKKGVKELGK